jgi:hypothetical protein
LPLGAHGGEYVLLLYAAAAAANALFFSATGADDENEVRFSPTFRIPARYGLHVILDAYPSTDAPL